MKTFYFWFLCRAKQFFFSKLTSFFFFFFRKYKPITTYEQRCLYKKDFNAELPEYESLKAKVDSMKKKIHDLQSKRLQFPEGTAEREVSVWYVFMLIELKGTATICHTILQLCNGRAEIAWCLELHKISFSLKRQRVGFKISLGLEFAPSWSFECKRIEKILESVWLFWDFLITAFFNLSLSLPLSSQDLDKEIREHYHEMIKVRSMAYNLTSSGYHLIFWKL